MNVNNSPLTKGKNTPLALEEHDFVNNSSNQVINAATDEYKKHGKGLTYVILLNKGLANSKKQAQSILKYHLRKGTLEPLSDKRPQEYYLPV